MEETRELSNHVLDVMLNELLKNTHISWSNAERINDIKKALKSNDRMYKRRILSVYNGLTK